MAKNKYTFSFTFENREGDIVEYDTMETYKTEREAIKAMEKAMNEVPGFVEEWWIYNMETGLNVKHGWGN